MGYMRDPQGRRLDRTRVPLVVFVGESNTGGLGLNSALSAPQVAVRSSVKIWDNVNNDGFDSLDIGTNNLLGHTGLTGVDDGAGSTYDLTRHGWENALADSAEAGDWNEQVYLLKAGQGGSTLSQWENADTYWTTFVARITAAVTYLRAQALEPDVYVFSSIGINDHIAGTTDAAYKTAVLDYVTRIRATIESLTGVANAPVAFTELPADRDTYNAKLVEIEAADPLFFLTETTDCPLAVDGNHWTSAGLDTMAGRMIETMLTGVGQGVQYDVTTTAPAFAGGARVTTLETLTADLETRLGVVEAILAAVGGQFAYVPVIWSSMSSGVTDGGSGRINGSGSANVGGMYTQALDANNFSVIWDLASMAVTSGVVVLLDTDNGTNYTWNTATFVAALYQVNSDIYRAVSGAAGTDTTLNVAAYPAKFRMENDGDDVVGSVSTDGGNNWTTVYTWTGALAGLSYLYLKVIFATATASQHVEVSNYEFVSA